MIRSVWILAMMAAAGLVGVDAIAAERPNILIILADDLGYSDLGCYGGEIETPHIDGLAAEGLRYSQFYNTARCWPSRAALMTGLYPHQAGMAMIYGRDAPAAYRGVMPPGTELISERLAPLGYRSYHAGKWHLNGPAPDPATTLPLARGFVRSYAVMGHDNYFAPRSVLDDGLPVPEFPDDYYVTDAISDRMVACLQQHAIAHEDQPFFGYLAYTAPHFPLHARAEDVATWLGRFREGWDISRARRLEHLRREGLLDCGLSPRDPEARAWDELTEDDQAIWDARMAVYAAMIASMDRGIGRVLEQIDAMGAADDTLVMFLSDNGASAEYIIRGEGDDPAAPPGSRGSYKCLEIGWANAANAPLRMTKIWTHEGGISTPLVVRWPRGISARGEVRHDVGHLIDILPTLLELTGAGAAAEGARELPGRSLLSSFQGEAQPPRGPLFWEHQGNKALRDGDWKIVAEFEGDWELYDLGTDRSETVDLASRHPEIVTRLAKEWSRLAAEYGVVDWATFPQSRQKHTPEYRMK
ncbi:MAG: arylsulfatase [Planctomyces sp.]|nr:arylsulfatase [Planctomyces sp.]